MAFFSAVLVFFFTLAFAQDQQQEQLVLKIIGQMPRPLITNIKRSDNASLGYPTAPVKSFSFGYPYSHIQGDIVAGSPPDCQSVDFRKQLPPIRDQDSVGWCYAFAMADMISFKMGVEVSAIDVANATERSRDSYLEKLYSYFRGNTSDNEQRATSDGGKPQDVIDAFQEKGFCKESDLPINNKVFSDGRETLKDYFHEIARIEDAMHSPKHDPMCSYTSELHVLFPNIPEKEILNILMQWSTLPLADRLINYQCKNRIKPKSKIKADLLFNLSNEDMSMDDKKRGMDKILDSGRPIEIGYDSAILKDVNQGKGSNMNHDSAIVGRKWDAQSGQCEYLVRNSWGPSCDGYFDPGKCEGGYIYIPANRLIDATARATYIE